MEKYTVASSSVLPEDEEHVPFLDHGAERDVLEPNERDHCYLRIVAPYVLCAISIGLIIASLRYPTDEQCKRKMSTWSPMLEAVEYEWRHFQTRRPSSYYGKPTVQLESEWDGLWQYGSMGIQKSDLHLLNKSSSIDWKSVPSELGGGVTAFFEGFHQIHCLNLIRQYTYRDEYEYDGVPAFDKTAEMLLDHVEHCIEALRIVMMCQADTTPYLIEKRSDGQSIIRSDALYRCRRWDKLTEWANKHIVQPYNATEERIKHMAEGHYKAVDMTMN